MELIAESGFQCFPPRLPDQPIFYPVLTLEYAESIARDWNAPDAACGFAGFVTEFDMPEAYLARFEEQLVGGVICRELWVPAEKMSEFNAQILKKIRVIRSYFGPDYNGPRNQFELVRH